MATKAIGQIVPTSNEFIYDTVIVYDTVWEYETVYDTIWIYDTLFVDTTFNDLIKLKPIRIRQVYYSPSQDRNKTLVMPITKKKKQKIKRSKYYKFRLNLMHRKKTAKKNTKYSFNADTKLTLNPQKGTFDPRVLKLGLYSIEPYGGMSMQTDTYKYLSNSENNTIIKSATDNLPGQDYGLKFNYNLFQYGAQTGFGISKINEKFNYIETSYLVDSTDNYETISHIINLTDTVKYLDVDKLLQGDTLWRTYYYHYDTLLFEDSLFYTYDTTDVHTPMNKTNTHTLLEIPLVLSYDMSFNKTSILIKLGGVNQIHMFSSGKTFSNTNLIEDINENTHFTKYNIALYGGLGLVYDISKQVSLSLDAFYKYPLRKFSEKYNLTLNKQIYGLHVGIRYRFKKY